MATVSEATFRLDPIFLAPYHTMTPPWGFGVLSELVYLRTYSRIKPDGTNEVWWETVRRVVEGTYRMQERYIKGQHLGWNDERAQRSAQEMYQRMWEMKFLPPGRGLWAMGSSLTEERELYAALNNCGYISTENIAEDPAAPFCFLMDMSMLGVGVGFDVKGAKQIQVQRPLSGESYRYTISDTREGWVDSVRVLLLAFLQEGGILPDFQYHLVREAGLPIQGFGGVSSGPEPLRHLHAEITAFLTPYAHEGRLLDAEGITTIMNLIGVCVVAGNVRRTAEIVFGNPDDDCYLNLKDYRWNAQTHCYEGSRADRAGYGWTSNNSVFATVGMDYRRCAESTRVNGEPGYQWMQNARNYGRMVDPPNFADFRAAGANPCFAPGTLVQTEEGHFPIEELVGETARIWEGRQWLPIANFRVTGEHQPLLKITLHDGSELRVTPSHTMVLANGQKVRADALQPEMRLAMAEAPLSHGTFRVGGAYLKGFLIAEGNAIKGEGVALWVYASKFACQERLLAAASEVPRTSGLRSDARSAPGFWADKGDRRVAMQGLIARRQALHPWVTTARERLPDEVFMWDAASKADLIAGVMDGDGTALDTSHGLGYQLTSTHREWLLDFQQLLKTMGVFARVAPNAPGGWNDFYNGRPPVMTRPTWRLTISGEQAIQLARQVRFERLTSFADRQATYRVRPRWNRVVTVENAGIAEKVYCCTVSTTHTLALTQGIQVGQCVEQTLEPYELCCLVETFIARHETLADYERTLKFAYLYAKTVTLGRTHWSETNKVMLRNRRIGCSMSGVQQFVVREGLDNLRLWCEAGYQTICRWDRIYSDWLCINESIKKTSIKPSGTVSLLAGATPGEHWPEDLDYLRRMRLSKNSDLVAPLVAAGFHVEPCVGSEHDTVVVAIPVSLAGSGLRPVREVSIWEQVAMAAFLQRYWSDNQVSCTVTFDPEREGDQIAHILEYFQYHLKGISFLPRVPAGAYAQMPYEAITHDEYERRVALLHPLQLGEVSGEEADVEKFCDGASCQVLT